MRQAATLLSMLALVATVVPSLVFFAGRITIEQMKMAMNVAAIVWFAATPLWMGRAPRAADAVADPTAGAADRSL